MILAKTNMVRAVLTLSVNVFVCVYKVAIFVEPFSLTFQHRESLPSLPMRRVALCSALCETPTA